MIDPSRGAPTADEGRFAPLPARLLAVARRLLVAAVGGALFATAFPPFRCWPERLLPVASVGALVGLATFFRALRGASARVGAAAGLAFGVALVSIVASWVPAAAARSGAGALAGVGVLAGLAASFGVHGAFHAVASRRLRHWPFAVMAFWIALESVRALCPAEPVAWYTLAHALSSSQPLYQLASVVGGPGLGALVLVAALLLEQGIEEARARPSRAVTFVVAGIGLPLIGWELGFFRLVSAVPTEAAIAGASSVIAVQDDTTPESKLEMSVLGKLRAKRDLTPHVDLLAWPEQSWQGRPDAAPLAPVVSRAVMLATALLVPYREPVDAVLARSAALLVGWSGHTVLELEKRHPDPVLEPDIVPGTERGPAVADLRPGVRVGFLLGQDGTRTDRLLELRRDGARVIVVASHDPGTWPWAARQQQAALCALRACEHRCPVVHVSARGVTFGLDEYGRPYALLAGDRRGFVLARVLAPRGTTLYEDGLHHLPWLAGAVALLSLGALARKRRDGT